MIKLLRSNGFGGFTDRSDNSTLTPSSKGLFGVGYLIYEANYCAAANCTKLNQYVEAYKVDDEEGGEKIIAKTLISLKKFDEATWMIRFEAAYNDKNVLGGKPFDTNTVESFTGYKFTEDDWKIGDPKLGTSPYVEPNGVITGGFIAFITIAAIIVAVAIFFLIYKRGVEARERRVKQAVAKAIAKSMTFISSKTITPRELEGMFGRIDVDGNGSLSMDEIKGLVEEAGVAQMSDNDYKILFASIDIDDNGSLDFVEFCSFFAAISYGDTGNGDTFC